MQRWKRVVMATAVLSGAATAVTWAPAAGAGPREEHCVVRVIGKTADGELQTTDPVCSTTRADALRRSGAAATDWPIGVHFDGPSYTGSSFTVVGADCTGGWLNLNAAWINRVSSTMHGCPRIRHFDGYNLVTPAETTLYPGANLLGLNNKTNSIQYLP
jgi:hypothetical protein